MKRILSLIAALLLLSLPFSCALADGAASWDPATQSYLYTGGRYGIVLCTRMNVRDQPSTRGNSYGSIKNGQPVKILGITQDNDFYVLDLASCGFTNTAFGAFGYAKTSLIKIDPQFIATTKTTNLYATPWSQELKNGEQSGRFFLLIDQYNGWYAVQSTESSPGSAFIRARDIGQYNTGYRDLYVVTWDCPFYDEYTWAQTRTAKRFTPGNVISESGDYSLIVLNEGTVNEVRGWVPTLNLAPIIN